MVELQKIIVQSVQYALLPVVTISNHLKYLQIREDMQNSGKRPIPESKFRIGVFYMVQTDAHAGVMEAITLKYWLLGFVPR